MINHNLHFQGKKLLVLGATKFLAEVVKEAKFYGAYVVVVDYNNESPAKKIADESLLCDVMDVDKIVDYININNIDGVITGFTDSLLSPYLKICKKANLPCYLSDQSLKFTTDKQYFKKLCKKFKIPVVPEYEIADSNKKYPLIIKPVDNSGARGISICKSLNEFNTCLQYSLSWSKSKKVLIEDYIDSNEATVFYLFQDGQYHLTAMGDRHVINIKDNTIKLPTGYTFPSKGLEKFQLNLDDKFKQLFKYLNLYDGMMFIQGFIDKDHNFIPYECGYRLTGSFEYNIIDKCCGFNPMLMCVNHALTGKMSFSSIKKYVEPNFKTKAYNISLLIKPGKISKIQGVDELKNVSNIIFMFQSYESGDEIDETQWGKLSQVFLRVLFVAESDKQYAATIEKLNQINVFDPEGKDLLINKKIIK